MKDPKKTAGLPEILYVEATEDSCGQMLYDANERLETLIANGDMEDAVVGVYKLACVRPVSVKIEMGEPIWQKKE